MKYQVRGCVEMIIPPITHRCVLACACMVRGSYFGASLRRDRSAPRCAAQRCLARPSPPARRPLALFHETLHQLINSRRYYRTATAIA